eukprot:366104-Chlamydomonas_euryale.AAC.1
MPSARLPRSSLPGESTTTVETSYDSYITLPVIDVAPPAPPAPLTSTAEFMLYASAESVTNDGFGMSTASAAFASAPGKRAQSPVAFSGSDEHSGSPPPGSASPAKRASTRVRPANASAARPGSIAWPQWRSATCDSRTVELPETTTRPPKSSPTPRTCVARPSSGETTTLELSSPTSARMSTCLPPP